jgi:hypothetical protein
MRSKHRFAIGIDPGIECGFAIFDRVEKKLIACKSMELWELFESLQQWKDNGIQVYIENPSTWLKFRKTTDKEAAQALQGAGAVKQSFKHITQYLDHLCIVYVTTKLQGTLKKVGKDKFALYTKWKGNSNQHGRDAALMVFNS